MKTKIEEAAAKAADKINDTYNGYRSDIHDLRDLFTQGAKFALENQWHCLTENPNDLPENMDYDDENVVAIVVEKPNGVRFTSYSCFDVNYWQYVDKDHKVVAWMYMPQFKSK